MRQLTEAEKEYIKETIARIEKYAGIRDYWERMRRIYCNAELYHSAYKAHTKYLESARALLFIEKYFEKFLSDTCK